MLKHSFSLKMCAFTFQLIDHPCVMQCFHFFLFYINCKAFQLPTEYYCEIQLKLTSKDPFQPKAFYDSMIHFSC